MNETVTLVILAVFDAVILGFGIYLVIAGSKMKKTKEIGTLILAEEEIKGCMYKEQIAAYFCWREAVMGLVFILFGVLRLLNKFVLKANGVLDICLMVLLLATVFWFFKSIQTARSVFLSNE